MWRSLAALLLAGAGAGAAALVVAAVTRLLPPIGDELDSTHDTYPQLARQPRYEIEIGGTAPPRFDLRLTAYYLTNGAPGCESMPTLLSGVLEGAMFNSRVSVPLHVERRGTAFTARLTVDRYIPGKCDWQFGYVSAVVSKGALVIIPNYIIIARTEFNGPREDTPFANATDLPVTLRCSFKGLAGLPANRSSNACALPPLGADDKHRHYLTHPVKRIVVHFRDYD